MGQIKVKKNVGGIEGLCIIDAGHYGIEHIFIDEIMEYLKKNTDNIEIAGMSYDNPQHFI